MPPGITVSKTSTEMSLSFSQQFDLTFDGDSALIFFKGDSHRHNLLIYSFIFKCFAKLFFFLTNIFVEDLIDLFWGGVFVLIDCWASITKLYNTFVPLLFPQTQMFLEHQVCASKRQWIWATQSLLNSARTGKTQTCHRQYLYCSQPKVKLRYQWKINCYIFFHE